MTTNDMVQLANHIQYESLVPVLKSARQSVSEAKAKSVRLTEVRINGNIQFNIGGVAVAIYKGSEGVEMNPLFFYHMPFDFKLQNGLLP